MYRFYVECKQIITPIRNRAKQEQERIKERKFREQQAKIENQRKKEEQLKVNLLLVRIDCKI